MNPIQQAIGTLTNGELPPSKRFNQAVELLLKAQLEHDHLLAVNRKLVEACEAYMREWNDTLAADYKDSPLETIATKCRTALAAAKEHQP